MVLSSKMAFQPTGQVLELGYFIMVFSLFIYAPSFLIQWLNCCRTLGTPDNDIWPGVSELPDYKTTFPKWPVQSLENVIPSLHDPAIDILQVINYSMNFVKSKTLQDCKMHVSKLKHNKEFSLFFRSMSITLKKEFNLFIYTQYRWALKLEAHGTVYRLSSIHILYYI